MGKPQRTAEQQRAIYLERCIRALPKPVKVKLAMLSLRGAKVRVKQGRANRIGFVIDCMPITRMVYTCEGSLPDVVEFACLHVSKFDEAAAEVKAPAPPDAATRSTTAP